jgi:ubiquinone biosynthesis protein
VPPFPSEQVDARRARLRAPIDAVFRAFDLTPVASASVAQVHFAELPDGTPVAVKVLRPNIADVIEHDLALMQHRRVAGRAPVARGTRLKPREVVAEFDKTIHDELDLTREAANCVAAAAQLPHSPLICVPEIYWDWTSSEVLVMERMAGVPIGPRRRADALRHRSQAAVARGRGDLLHAGVPRRFLPRRHASGQHLRRVDPEHHGKYVALDFGIMGTLSERDKSYLAQNFIAFFRRDYPRVATAHIESDGCRPHARRRAGKRDPRRLRADLRPAVEGDLAREGAGQPVPGVAALQRRDPAAARAAAEDAAQRRRASAASSTRPRPVGDRQSRSSSAGCTSQIGWRALERRLFAEPPSIVQTLPELPRLIHQNSARRRSDSR